MRKSRSRRRRSRPSKTPFEISRRGVALYNIKFPESGVQYNSRFNEMLCAHWWGYQHPFDFLTSPREERALMLAVYDSVQKVEFLASETARRDAEAEAKKNRAAGGRR